MVYEYSETEIEVVPTCYSRRVNRWRFNGGGEWYINVLPLFMPWPFTMILLLLFTQIKWGKITYVDIKINIILFDVCNNIDNVRTPIKHLLYVLFVEWREKFFILTLSRRGKICKNVVVFVLLKDILKFSNLFLL